MGRSCLTCDSDHTLHFFGGSEGICHVMRILHSVRVTDRVSPYWANRWPHKPHRQQQILPWQQWCSWWCQWWPLWQQSCCRRLQHGRCLRGGGCVGWEWGWVGCRRRPSGVMQELHWVLMSVYTFALPAAEIGCAYICVERCVVACQAQALKVHRVVFR